MLQAQKEAVMLLAILVKRVTLQSTLIAEFASVGFSPTRIAELLGASRNTVNVTLTNTRKKKLKK